MYSSFSNDRLYMLFINKPLNIITLSNRVEKIGHYESWKYTIKPPEIKIIKTIRPKYKDAQGSIHIAELNEAFPKTNFDASFIAYMIVQKFMDHCVLRKNVNWIRHSYCIKDEGRSLGIGLQELISNYQMLLYLRGRVVSDLEKVLQR
jgi:hypothetical protein